MTASEFVNLRLQKHAHKPTKPNLHVSTAAKLKRKNGILNLPRRLYPPFFFFNQKLFETIPGTENRTFFTYQSQYPQLLNFHQPFFFFTINLPLLSLLSRLENNRRCSPLFVMDFNNEQADMTTEYHIYSSAFIVYIKVKQVSSS